MGTGVEEVAVADGAKTAGEAVAADAAAAGAADAGIGTLGTIAAGSAPVAGLTALGTEAGLSALPELATLGAGLGATEAGLGTLGTIAPGSAPVAGLSSIAPEAGIGAGLESAAAGIPALGAGPGGGLGTLGTIAPGSAPSSALPATPQAAPIAPAGAGGGADIPGLANPLEPAGAGGGGAAQYTGLPTGGTPPASAPIIPDTPAIGPGPGAGAPPLQAAAVPQSTMDKILGAISNNPLQAANVGLSGLSVAKQLGGVNSAQRQLNAIGQPAKDVSNQLLQQFQAGQLSGADAFQIAQYSQQQRAAVDQYYAKAGLSNSSMHLDALKQVDAQAEQMRQQALQNMLKGGLGAAGVSDPTLRAGVTAGVNQDAAAMKAMQDFLSTLSGMQVQQTKTGSPTGP